MSSADIAALIVFLVCIVLSRTLTERAFRRLVDDDKRKLVDALAGMRIYSLIPLVVVVALVFGASYVYAPARLWSGPVGLGVIVAYLVAMHLVLVRRLRSRKLPDSFVRSFLLARHVSHLGALALFASVAYGFWVKRHAPLLP